MNILKPLRNRVKNRVLWGFDIETYGNKNKFLMGSVVGDLGVKEIFWDKLEFVNFFKKYCDKLPLKDNPKRLGFSDGYLTATNLQFDILALIHETKLFRDIEPFIRNSQMIFMKIPIDKEKHERHSLKFIDTLSFARFSVKKLGEILKLPKLEKPEFLGKKNLSFYQKIELEKYNLRDSEITYRAIKLLQNGFNDLGGNLKITIASTALDLYRRKYMSRNYYQPDRALLNYLYQGYYGGRVEAIKRGRIKNLNYYDVNSLYPSVMIRKYPQPNKFKYQRYINIYHIKNFEGVARVKIKAPDMYIPYLPYRTDDKLLFPIGIFKGSYTFFELRKALELGYEIIKYYDAVIYFKYFYPFRNYVNELYALRKEQKRNNNPIEFVTKKALNSLYGKFAQRYDEKEIIIHESKVDYKMIQENKYVSRSGEFFIFKQPYTRIPAFVNPIFSLYTTAYARDILYDLITEKEEQVYYYDTDSCITKTDIKTSLDLGGLKKEFTIKTGILVKPKMYLLNNKGKCKGVGFLDSPEFLTLLNTKKAKIRRFAKFKESNKRKLHYNQLMVYDKLLNFEDDKRIWSERFNPDVLQDSKAIAL